MKKFSLLMLFAVSAISVFAQTSVGLPTCSGYDASLIYYIGGDNSYLDQIYNYDPAQPLSSTNPWPNTISGTMGGGGITLGPNVFASSPAITFYVCGTPGNNYYWYNGSTWVNSGFNVGNNDAINPVISGGNFYNIVGATGEIYKNTPTTNGTLLTTVSGFHGSGPYDLAGDVNGNFFAFNVLDSVVKEFDSTGTLVTSWTASNTSTIGAIGGGLAIMGYTIYCTNIGSPNNLWMGTLLGTNYSFTPIGNLNPEANDFASCQTSNALRPGAHGPLGVANIAEGQIKLYPNPADKELMLLTPKGMYSTYTINNVKGDVVMQGTISNPETNIDVRILAPGNYFIKMASEDGETNVRQFVKN